MLALPGEFGFSPLTAVISHFDMRHPPENSIIRRKLFDFWFVRALSFLFMFRLSLLSSITEANYYDSA
jgi:hypothetical protein